MFSILEKCDVNMWFYFENWQTNLVIFETYTVEFVLL